jgi:uncharacterized lipoprotein YmbA
MKFGCALKCGSAFLFSIVISLLTGCMRDSKPIEFYMLNADSGITAITQAPAADRDAVIGLGPITIPEYLNRPQIVTEIADNQYRLSEDHRWAERLDQNISLALLKALPRQLGTGHIVRYPWSLRQAIDYQVGIDILEFNVDANGQSRLIAQWFIKPKDKPSINKRSSFQFPASATDYAIMVKAQSQCLTKLGQEISAALRQLMAEHDAK